VSCYSYVHLCYTRFVATEHTTSPSLTWRATDRVNWYQFITNSCTTATMAGSSLSSSMKNPVSCTSDDRFCCVVLSCLNGEYVVLVVDYV
jgi:hypothetical protein